MVAAVWIPEEICLQPPTYLCTYLATYMYDLEEAPGYVDICAARRTSIGSRGDFS